MTKGAWNGGCFTPGCEARARFISMVDAKLADALGRYRCEPCCDAIANKVATGIVTVDTIAGLTHKQLMEG